MAFSKVAQISAIFLLCLALSGCEAQGQAPGNADEALAKAKDIAAGKVGPDVQVFNVIDNGAKADGTADCSINFIRTFKAACNSNANAMMVIPEGNYLLGPVMFQGPCSNPNSLIIQVNGMVKAQPEMTYFTGGASDATDWISLQNIKGLIITGNGTFHGQGAELWKSRDCSKGSDCARLPANLKLIKVNDAIIYGIKSVDPKGFHMMISWAENMKIFNVNLSAPGDSPNTDGIHMSKSSLVHISDCVIATGDDCVSIIHGSSNVTVTNTACGPGHGFSIGSLGKYDSEADVSGITVKNCSLTNTDNGVRIKTYQTQSPSKASSILFQDITMNAVKNPIIIDQEYGNKNSNEPSKVSINDVQYVNINGTSTSKAAVSLTCSASNPCQGIQMNNVNLQFNGPPDAKPFGSSCVNAKVTYTGPQSPPPCSP
ncbi:hypothetical protein PTKIN_Ptkin10aG0014900 [Pterospermum kingtungense]